MRLLLGFAVALVFSSRGWAGTDALDAVNAARAARGLRPFAKDANLTAAAIGAADFRATYRIPSHTSNDFAFLPSGALATAAGTNVARGWPPSLGWGACCTYEDWQYAGAAWSVGSDGNLYCHIFVRGGSGASPPAARQDNGPHFLRRLFRRR